MLNDEAGYRALLGIGCSSLGGLVIDAGAYLETTDWTVGVFDLPGGADTTQVAVIDPGTKVEPTSATKLHYHPSGLLSADQSGHVKKETRKLQAAPMTAFHGEHVFTVLVIDPGSFESVEGRRKTDLIVQAPQSPRVLKFVVYLTQVADLDPRLQAVESGFVAVPPENDAEGNASFVLTHLNPHAAIVTVDANPPEFSTDGRRNIFAVGVNHEEMVNPALATRTLVVHSIRDTVS